MKDFSNVQVMWEPKEDSAQRIKDFKDHITKKYNVELNDYWSLHKWSVEHLREFWAEIWDLADIIYSKPYDEVFPIDAKIENAKKWFPGVRLNYAENLLKYRDDHTALICAGEDCETRKISYAELYKQACIYGAALRKLGLKTGDTVACYMSNREEAIFAMLGATSVGAIWSGALPLLGSKAALSRFNGIQPKFLFTVDRFRNDGEEKDMLPRVKEVADELQSLEKIIIVPSQPESVKKDISNIKNSCFLKEFQALGYNEDGSIPDLEFVQLPFDHPVFVSYTSGTTGKPKGLVHGIGGLIALCRDFWIHNDANREDVWLSMSPVGWATWNIFMSMLALGLTVVLYEGVPYYLSPTYIWDFIDRYKISHTLLTPTVLDNLEKKGYVPTEKNHLSSLKVILSGASVVKPQNYDFVYKKVKTDVIFGSAYGSTEMMGACMLLEQSLPVHRGEISAPSMGIDIHCFSDSGKSVLGEVGELVITTPSPSFPLSLWNDDDDKLYKDTYYSQFEGAFCLGDLCLINPVTRGMIIYGRSDDTLKPKGVRFGSTEIYNIVDTFPEVRDSICVSQYNSQMDERAVLFMKMRHGHLFTEDLVHTIRRTIARELTEGHVPEIILETKDIPHNLNGKKMEAIVKKIINNRPYDAENVKNQECLQYFADVPELQGYN